MLSPAKAAEGYPVADALKALTLAFTPRPSTPEPDATLAALRRNNQQVADRAILAAMLGSKPRRSTPRNRTGRAYTVLRPTAASLSRRGTWRHYMVSLILAHTSVGEAERLHADNVRSGQWPASKTLDFAWVAKQGFIKWEA